MTHFPPQPVMDDFFDTVTDAVLGDAPTVTHIYSHYGVLPADVDGTVNVVWRLRRVMRQVRPSRRYVYRLHRQLVGDHARSYGVIARVRYLPARVQIAAALALAAGASAMWLVRRRRLQDELVEALD